MKDKLNELDKVVDNLKESKCCIIATDLMCVMNGNKYDLLTLLTCIINELKNNGFDKDALDFAYDLALKEKEDVLKQVKDTLQKIIDEIE